MRVDVLSLVQGQSADEVQIAVHQPSKHMPEWMLIKLEPTDRPFRTLPPDHYFSDSPAIAFAPLQILETARSLSNGEISLEVAQTRFEEALTAWHEMKAQEEQERRGRGA